MRAIEFVLLEGFKEAREIATNSNITKYARVDILESIKLRLTEYVDKSPVSQAESFKMKYDIQDYFISLGILLEISYKYESKLSSYNESTGV